MHTQLKEHITKALHTLGIEGVEPHLEFPGELAHGDFATNVALAAAQQAKTSPKKLAEQLVETLGQIDGVEKIEVAGPGFINFHLASSYFTECVLNVDESWGKNTHYKDESVMVEYTDPNPFKEFHIGHLMSNAIGESIARLFEYSGAHVQRANWQGDVGPHVAKALWGKTQKPELSWGEAYVYGSREYEKNKEAIDSINKKVYDKSDSEINALYNVGRAESLAHFEEIYKTLGTTFDHYFFEGTEGLVGKPLVEEYLKKGVFKESEGAVVFPGEEYGLHTRVFLTSQGLPTYEAKELGLNKAKFETVPDLDRSVIVTANEQSSYFQVILKAMEFVLPKVAEKTHHIAHGMMRFAEGKMSSRKGNVITGESLLNDLRAIAEEKMKERELEDAEAVAAMVAVAGIKYAVLRQAIHKDIIFNQEQAISLEGDSGPYLQYAYVRAKSVLEKAGTPEKAQELALELIPEFARLLPRFPSVVERAAREYEPHFVATYLIELASAFNSWYAQEKVIGSPDEVQKLVLVGAFAQTIKNGLWLLGIETPEKM